MSRLVILPVQTFESVCGLAKARMTAKPGRGLPDGSGESSMKGPDASWDGGVGTLAAAVTLAERGWDAGITAVAKAMEVYDPEIAPTGGFDLDVAGAFPCVPSMLSGEPECMYVAEEGPAPRRVRLVMSGSYLWDVPADLGITYAAACGAYAATLMARGLDVAITAVQVNTDHGSPTRTAMVLAVKEYGQEPDASRIAVASHPGFFRRVGFAWREMTAEIPQGSRSGGYGSTSYNPREMDLLRSAIPDASDERIIALPGLDSKMPKTVEKMLEYFHKAAIDSAEKVQS